MNLPPNVRPVKDRHGRTRHRFRKKGLPSRYLAGEPDSAEFLEDYKRCLDPTVPWHRLTGSMLVRPNPKRQRRNFVPYRGREVVYFIGSGTNLVKIGTTVNLYARVKKLQTGSGPVLRLLACVDGGAGLEAEYHERFAESRFRGEWFYHSDAIKAEVRRLQSEVGRPTLNP